MTPPPAATTTVGPPESSALDAGPARAPPPTPPTPPAPPSTGDASRHELESLPGVGPQLAGRLRARFGSDAGFLQAAAALDLEAIASVEGLSERRAVSLVQAVRGADDGGRFLATDAARRVHDDLMDRLQACAATPHGRNRLGLLPFYADPDEARRHVDHVLACRDQVAGMDVAATDRALRAVGALDPPRPRPVAGMLLVAEDDDAMDRLHRLGLGRWAALGTPSDLAEAHDYELVVLAFSEGALDVESLPNVVEVPAADGAAALCPQAVLARFRDHAKTLQALADLAQMRGTPSVAADALELLGTVAPVDAPDEADLLRMVDAERLRVEAEVDAQAQELSISGRDLLAALSGGRLPAPLQQALQDAAAASRHRIRDATGLDVQPFRPGLPVQVDEEGIQEALLQNRSRDQMATFRAAQQAAKRLEALAPALEEEVRAAWAFDVDFALGRFAAEHRLGPFAVTDRLHFTGGLHLGLAGLADAQRVDYHVGGDENVALLTGANSGGKSTLLEHLAQVAVLARMGLPVPGAHAEVPWLDELHLVTPRRGMDAGAFETFLRGFLPVVHGDARRLVLVDEVEAVTELDAAARILAFTLDRLSETGSLGVVVTHLAPQVLTHVRSARVRVDGIQATGLDDRHRLVVERSPRIGQHARSTPELIVARLAQTTRGPERSLYEALLATFSVQGQP